MKKLASKLSLKEALKKKQAKFNGEKERSTCIRYLAWLFGNKIRNAQATILLMLGSLLISLTLVIWFYTSHHEMQQVERFALRLQKELLQRTAAHLVMMLASLDRAITSLAVTLQSDIVSSTEVPPSGDLWATTQVSRAIWSIMAANTFLQTVSYVRQDGDLVSVLRDSKNKPWSFLQNNTKNATVPTWYGKEINITTGLPVGKIIVAPQTEDVRKRDYYYEAAKLPNFGTYYTDFATEPDTRISFSMRVFGRGRQTAQADGVIISSITMQALADFIGDLNLLQGFMYVVNSKGFVYAVSPGISASGRHPHTGAPRLIHPSEINHPVIPAVSRYLETQTTIQGMLENDFHFSNFKVHRERYYIGTTVVKWSNFSGAVVLIIPRHSILHDVDRGVKKLAIFLFVLAAGTMLLAQVFVVFLTKYMAKENKLKKNLVKEQEAKARAEACSASARLFLANLSHDLGTPMSAVIAILQLVGGSRLDADQKSLLEQAQSSGSSLHSLVNSILDISTIESGALELAMTPLKLFDEILHLVDVFSVEAISTGIDLLLDLPTELPLVMGDKMRLKQIFVNLLSNCIKFTPKGHVVIRGTVVTSPPPATQENDSDSKRKTSWRSSKDNGWSTRRNYLFMPRAAARHSALPELQSGGTPQAESEMRQKLFIAFEVEDSGQKIPPEHKELLFENFVSAPDNYSRYGGTGVGLGIVRSLVKLMGGDIASVERSGCGAVFSFVLAFPLAPQDGVPANLASPMLPEMYRGTVILAMQEGLQRDIASSWLTSHGVKINSHETSWSCIPIAADYLWTTLQGQIRATKSPSPLNGLAGALTGTMSLSQGLSLGTVAEPAQLGAQVPETCGAGGGSPPPPAIIIIDARLVPQPQEFFTTVALRDFLRRLQKEAGGGASQVHGNQQVHVAWAFQVSMPEESRQALATAGCYMVQMPLVASRLASLMREVSCSRDTTADCSFLKTSASLEHIAETASVAEVTKFKGPEPNQALPKSGSLDGPVTVDHESRLRTNRLVLPMDEAFKGAVSTVWLQRPLARSHKEAAEEETDQSLVDPISTLSETLLEEKGESSEISLDAHPPAACPEESDDLPSQPRKLSSSTVIANSPSAEVKLPENNTVTDPEKGKDSMVISVEDTPLMAKPISAISKGEADAKVETSAGAEILPSASTATPSQPGSSNPLEGLVVLIVEDTPLMAKVASLKVKKLGAQVVWKADGRLGVETMASSHKARGRTVAKDLLPENPMEGVPNIDFILMDCQMPRMDGYEATQNIRKMEEPLRVHTPIVALTAHAMPADRKKCLDAGMDEYLTKPLDSDSLVVVAHRLIPKKG